MARPANDSQFSTEETQLFRDSGSESSDLDEETSPLIPVPEPAELDSVFVPVEDVMTPSDPEKQPAPAPAPAPVQQPPPVQRPPVKRKRGRPRAPVPVPAEPPAVPFRAPTPPPELPETELNAIKARSQVRTPQIKAYLGKRQRTPEDDAALDMLLQQEEEDLHRWKGEWEWHDFDSEMAYRNDGIVFTGDEPGLSEAAQRANSVLDCFRLYFTNKVIDNLVTQTNLYARQEKSKKGASKETWVPVGREDILAFLGVAVGMSLLPKSDVRDYWSGNEILESFWFPSVMSGRRFRIIQRYFHVADNEMAALTPEGIPVDKVYKVRPLIDSLLTSFRQHFHPNKELSIDEQMIGTKARCSFLQYVKNKPTKRGIKVWALCDAKVHYCLNFQVYTGGTGERGLGKRVVNDLMFHYLGKGHHVYFDNFYTSPELLAHLLSHNTLAVGTVRQDLPHMPWRLQSKHCNFAVGQNRFLQSHGMTACRWKDKRDVFCLSTVHGNTLKTITRRKAGGRGAREKVQKPLVVCDYNIYMGGVDVYDQLLSYHPTARRYKRWWLKLFWRLFDMSVLNALALWKLKNPNLPRGHHKFFKIQLATQLVAPLKESNVPVRPRFGVADRLQHYGTPINFPTQKTCVVCRDKNKKTTFGCELCGDGVRLHKSRGDGQPCCFIVYHTTANYR